MSAKYSYKDIKAIEKHTPDDLKGKQISEIKGALQVGYFHPSNANWSYLVYVVNHGGQLVEVATVFGRISY